MMNVLLISYFQSIENAILVSARSNGRQHGMHFVSANTNRHNSAVKRSIFEKLTPTLILSWTWV